MKYTAIMNLCLLGLSVMSCTGTRVISTSEKYESYRNKKKRVDVISVVTDTGFVYFSKKIPGKLNPTGVNGTQQIQIEKFHPDSVKFISSKSQEFRKIRYAYKKGIHYDVVKEDKVYLVVDHENSIDIPFSTIKSIKIKESRPDITMLTILGSLGAMYGILMIIYANMTISVAI